MRLINAETPVLHKFFYRAWDAPDFPKYAVFSHFWTLDEVTYKDAVKKRGKGVSSNGRLGNAVKSQDLAGWTGCEWIFGKLYYALNQVTFQLDGRKGDH